MGLSRFLLVALCLAPSVFAAGGPVRTPSQEVVEESRRLVDMRYRIGNLALNAASHRLLQGTLFAGTAALFSGALIANDRLRTDVPKELGRGVLAFSGGLAIVGALGSWFFSTEAEAAARTYLRSAATLPAADRLLLGETILRRAAHQARDSRYLIGGLFFGMGAADLIWHLAEGGTPATSFLAYKGALFTGLSAYFLFLPRPEELEYEGYLESRGESESPSASLQVVPLPSGVRASLAISF